MDDLTKRPGGRDVPVRSAAADAKQSTIALFLGTLSDSELDVIDERVMSIIRDRDRWARHVGESKFHLVESYEHYSVRLECRGRWALKDDFETCALPAKRDRCGACHLVYVATEGQRLVTELQSLFDVQFRTPASVEEKINDALRELRDIAPIEPPRFDGQMPDGIP